MKKILLATAFALGMATTYASADGIVLPDPLHFSCSNCGADNGTFTPSGNPPVGITVTASPAQSGDLTLKVLIPNNDTALLTDVFSGKINGTAFTGTANLFTSATQGTQWTTGSLEGAFLGITNFGQGSPPNDITAFLPSTQSVDPGATGFFVLTLDTGTQVSLNTPGGSSPINLDLANEFLGGWVMGDLLSTTQCKMGVTSCDVTTAQSAALFVNPAAVPGPVVGAGIPGLFGLGLMVLARLRQKRNEWRRMSQAIA